MRLLLDVKALLITDCPKNCYNCLSLFQAASHNLFANLRLHNLFPNYKTVLTHKLFCSKLPDMNYLLQKVYQLSGGCSGVQRASLFSELARVGMQ